MIFEVIKLGFFYGCFIGLIALGFALIYNVLHIVDFAHTDRMVISGYLFLTFINYFNQIISAVLSIIITIIISILTEYFLYKKFRKRNPKLLIISSFGLSIIIQNLLAIVYTDNLKEYPFFENTFFNTNIYYRELFLLPFLLLVSFLLYYWLKRSKNGLSIRALISNFEKSLTIGIPYEKLYLIVFSISGLIAGVSGVYLSMGFGLTPYSGFKIMLLAFSASLVAGLDNIYGAVFIGILLGMLISIFEYLTNSLVAESLTLLILLSILLIKPNGIFGNKLRII